MQYKGLRILVIDYKKSALCGDANSSAWINIGNGKGTQHRGFGSSTVRKYAG